MRHTLLLSVAYPDLPYFLHNLIEGTIFGKRFIQQKNVFWFPLKNSVEAFFVLRGIRRDITINANTASCKVKVILKRFYETGIFTSDIHLSIQFFKSRRRLPETKRHSSLFLHWSGSTFLVVMTACTPFIHVFPGRSLFLHSLAIQSID